ncbi:MAG: flagellar filament capping protein FliD [Betaproteobacteria bacterium]|nr:flagellar filament capping protein FliD [Betaproteobacteria bacterium]
MAITSPGIGSNLDVNGIISSLMALERKPVTALDTTEASYQAKLSAYGSLKGSLASFQSAAQALSTPAKFLVQKAAVADAGIFSATAGSGAASGSYGVEVGLLAQAQKLKSTAVTATSSTIGSGTLTIDFGTYSGDSFTLNPDKATKTISIASGQSSLAGIRDAINAANAGVTAGIVNDGTGYRLTLSSRDTGAANALRVVVADSDGTHTDTSGLSQLMFDGRTSGVKNLTQSAAAQNASITIDGILISKASNAITDAIEGVTLNLLKQSTAGTTTNLLVVRDSTGIRNAVESFVKAYNDSAKALKDISAYNAATKQAAVLQGDGAVRSIQSALRNVLNSALTTAGGGLTMLSDIGIAFQTDGTLALDSAKLQTVVDDPTKDISTLFAAVGKPTDSLVSFGDASSSTKAGNYAINVSQLAAQGAALGNVVLGGTTTITAGLNDGLSLSVDGIAATVTLTAGDYTPAQLAAEIQSKINGAGALSAVGSKVTVSLASGTLSITSNRYGSASKIQSISGSALAGTFGTADYTNGTGKDVAGTIGGVAATGSGQALSGAGDAVGLSLKISGGATGVRGSVKFAQGYAAQLDKLLGGILASDGTLTSRTDGINRSIKDLGARRDALNLRLAEIEKRYRAQYTALDMVMSNMTKTSTFLQQQLANLPGAAKK